MRRMIGLLLCILLIINGIFVGYAEEQKHFNDVEGHWAQKQINKCVENNLLAGYEDGTIRPNGKITKAEFITLINKIYGFYITDDENYIDVKKNNWYYEETAIGKKNGYMDWYKEEKLAPNQPITRQEVCAAIGSILQLKETEDLKEIEKFVDQDTIPEWSKKYIDAAVKNKYISGYPDKSVRPNQEITRAEAVVILDKVIGERINEKGVYGPEKGSRIIQGNMTINAQDVKLRNTTIEGDMIFGAGIKEGEVDLENVIVKGRTIVKGGGENSITFKNCTMEELIVLKVGGKVRVVSADSAIGKAILASSAKLKGEFKDAKIEIIGANDTIELDGSFEEVLIGSKVEVNITEDTAIEKMMIEESAKETAVTVGKHARIDQIIFNGAAHVNGEGAIKTAKINVDGVSVAQSVEKKIVKEGIKDTQVKEENKHSSSSSSSSSSPKKSSEKSITATTIGSLNNGNLIDVPEGTTVKALKEGLTLSAKATAEILQASGGAVVGNQETAQVTDTMVIQVTAEDGTKAEYTITIARKSSEKSITATTIGFLKDGNLIDVPERTKVKALKAALTVSAKATAEILASSGRAIVEDQETAQVTADMVIQVTAEDGTKAEYTIAVGAGASEAKPIHIYTAEQLNEVRNGLGKYYKLEKDIDLTDISWIPIGTPSKPFTGTFDGNEKTISNLTINTEVAEYIGLFGYTSDCATLKNIVLKDVDVKGNWYVGGLVGYNKGTIESSYGTGAVNGVGSVGGLVGYNTGTITDSQATGTVSGTGDYVGGLVGNNYNGTIENSYATGAVSGTSGYAGGLVGSNGGTITSSYATGTVRGDNKVGGLVGHVFDYNGKIMNSYATGAVKATGDCAGGLVGQSVGTIEDSYATGAVSGVDYVGGLVGWNNNDGGIIKNSYATGTVSGNSEVGGLVGKNMGTINDGSYAIKIKDIAPIQEADIKAGSAKIVLELEGGTWDLDSIDNIKSFLISNISNSTVREKVYEEGITTDGAKMTIPISQIENFTISEDQTVTITIPAVAIESISNIIETIDTNNLQKYGTLQKTFTITNDLPEGE